LLTIRAMSDGKGYSSRHLEHNDYYAEGERVVGQWQGRGAELLGLAGEVKSEDFEAVRLGLDPQTSEFLRLRHSADRLAADGMKLAQGRSLYDFTFSAPKSVSVMAFVGGDERLAGAHKIAVSEALREMERHAASRVRQDGANENRATGNLVLAVYHHEASRELDPQLHTHAVAANLTYDGAEGRWKALQSSEIYERRAYLTEVYRNALAREVRSLGYGIENRRDAKGRDLGFEIAGVSPELIARFSQRSRQRDAAIAQFTESHGRPPTDNEVAVLVRESRAEKLTEISTAEVRERQRSRVNRAEREQLDSVRPVLPSCERAMEPASASLDYARDHIFERVTVGREYELLTEALRHGRGRIALNELAGAMSMQEASGALLRSGDQVATRESLERERFMIAAVNRGVGGHAALSPLPFVCSDSLRDEQRAAVEFVLRSRDRVIAVSGAAGTGKTATLSEVKRGLLEAWTKVVAIAPTMSAVEELHKVGFKESMTVSRLVQDPRAQSSISGAVVIVDEAGMISSRQMADILQLAERHNSRIVLVGDTKQIQSVEAGDALRVLERESRMKSVSLTQVQRQIKGDYRAAIEELRRSPDRGFLKLDEIGAVHEVAWDERARTVAEAYSASARQSALVVCATHEEIDRVTDSIRGRRRESRELGDSTIVERHVSLNWTNAQKSNPRNFRLGHRLSFHRAVSGIAKNETVEVVRVGDKRIVVKTRSGERALTGRQAKCFDVMEARPIEVAAGDRLLLMANRRDVDFRATNGEIVTVARTNQSGRIELTDDRVLPADYRQFAHGYAVTATP
jgi:conjugative relaxase-like TrwC/TraI family protein